MELGRRLIFYLCCILGLILTMYVSLEPVVIVKIFDLSKDTRNKARKYAESLLSEEEQKTLKKKKQAEIIANTVTIEGNEWDEIYLNLKILQEGKELPNDWQKRIPDKKYSPKEFFFRIFERPVNSLIKFFEKDKQQIYLYLKQQNAYLETRYRKYSDDDFHLGSGFSAYPRPPTDMLYPYRKYGLGLFLLGLLVYIFLPYRTISSSALRYPKWRVILGDITVFILSMMFFSLPIFIAGGSFQAFTVGLSITAVMWLISLLGFYSIKIAAWYASYQILPVEITLR